MSSLLWSMLLLLALGACSEAERFLRSLEAADKAYRGVVDRETVQGEELAAYLSRTRLDQTLNMDSILEVMRIEISEAGSALSLQAGESEPPEVSDAAVAVLQGNEALKREIDTSAFIRINGDFFTPTPPGNTLQLSSWALQGPTTAIAWNHAEDEFLVSPVTKIPIKDQGYRPTCASFAGIGQIEGLLIKKYQLDGLDLSEQRFYFMSKPEHWANGGAVEAGGSNSGTGFARSKGFEHKGVTFPPDSPEDYNIPLESSCPYNPESGTNDLQTPQASTCGPGVAKVQDFLAWLYRWQERPATAQEVYDFLVEKDYPVIVATRLSDNWEVNDGMITLAESDGSGGTSHAVGHAYLVVGARKLDASRYPNEGGMCFIVRNSWGKGWGVNGHACMTLAWFNAWAYDTGFPQALDVDLDTSGFAEARLDPGYDPNAVSKPADNTPVPERKSSERTRRGTASFGLQNSDVGTPAVYLHRNGETFRFFYRITDGLIELNGLLADGAHLTRSLFLPYDAGKIMIEQDGFPPYQAGVLDEQKQVLSLCSERFTSVCQLKYRPEDQAFAIGLTAEQMEKEESTGPYDWFGFDALGYGIEFSKPGGVNTKADIRLKIRGAYTNPLRFLLDPLSGAVQYQGQTIGSVLSGDLCTGEFKSICRLVLSQGDFHVFLRAHP